MMQVQVFQNGDLVESRAFERQFMLILRDRQLQREYDAETAHRSGGDLQIWIHSSLACPYVISFVLPTWHLSINGLVQKPDFYTQIPIDADRIELIYEDYRFRLEQT